MQEIYFMREYWFLKIAFMGWEKCHESGKTVFSHIQERCQIKVENHRGIGLLNACCKL